MGHQQILLKQKNQDVANANTVIKMWESKPKESPKRTERAASREVENRAKGNQDYHLSQILKSYFESLKYMYMKLW